MLFIYFDMRNQTRDGRTIHASLVIFNFFSILSKVKGSLYQKNRLKEDSKSIETKSKC